jgi:hypothetical protein
MADVKEFVYRDKHVTVTVNQDAGKYIGVVDIEGMTVAPANKMGAASASPDAAFESAKRRAEELIDAAGKT